MSQQGIYVHSHLSIENTVAEAVQSILPPRKLVHPMGIGKTTWNQRHGAVFRTLLCSLFRYSKENQVEKGLSATLLQWQPRDFPFRELAYTLLCMAVGGQHLIAIEHSHLKQDFAYAFLHDQPFKQDGARQRQRNPCYNRAAPRHFPPDSSPECLSQLLSGSYLEGTMPGTFPNDIAYWFNGALVVLISGLRHDPSALEGGLQQIVHHQQ